ncbi:PREDICTED: uncharacterized protein LOC104823169 isoform X2 [Tarenaya hassleriana]|uniref:uncharacterized protein LOC104823169 isoform X2 n=1 Tax=Tarenaya hassleriana TaxID=28532 RepID=UPI00053C3715|nr:PREDICTED: uncharacterized protein LOC104823169 isoform X2 [Tarenaya hassleriana]
MEEQGDVSKGFSSISRSDSKFVGEKRSRDDFVERQDFCPKIRRLDPNLPSETITVGVAHDSASDCSEKQFLLERYDKGFKAEKGIGLDLNTDAISSSASDELSACSSRMRCNTKSKDAFSECGSSNVPVEDKDPMKLWKAMKQNGFLSNPHGGISAASSCFVSSSHGGIPAPRKRGRENKSEAMKRKIEIARKEEIDRFAKLAAPSGLLNELNPGIINHVRNKRQVLSIIENLVKSKKDSGNFHRATDRCSGMALGGSKTNLEGVNADGLRSDPNQSDKWFMPLDKYPVPTRNYEEKCSDSVLGMAETIIRENKTLESKIQTAANFHENISSLSSEESADFSCANVLTVKAATVASQWLELLHQDIKGRLSALRRSRKRVRAVISTELPFLILKEFPFNQENDPNLLDGVSSTSRADIHKARWTALFNQMESALSEEEKQLESWLIQVRELQSHCDHGLQYLSLSSGQNFLQPGMPLDSRSAETLSSEKELAVRAAAASIYSTCNFLTSKENITCT